MNLWPHGGWPNMISNMIIYFPATSPTAPKPQYNKLWQNKAFESMASVSGWQMRSRYRVCCGIQTERMWSHYDRQATTWSTWLFFHSSQRTGTILRNSINTQTYSCSFKSISTSAIRVAIFRCCCRSSWKPATICSWVLPLVALLDDILMLR